jgi:hypothetical protein
VIQAVANEVVPPVVGAVDINEVVERVDIQGIIDRVDLQQVIERLDLNRVISGLDINTMVSQIDLEGLVRRTDIGAIIAAAGGGMASKAIDVARSEGVGFDIWVQRLTNRLLRRQDSARPPGPDLLVEPQEPVAS